MATKKKSGSGLPTLSYNKTGGDLTYDKITAPVVGTPEFIGTDLSLDQVTSKDVTAGTVSADTLADRFMTAADYQMVDPADISAEYGDIARSEAKKNSQLSSEIALQQLDTELKGLQSYAPAAAALQRGEIAKDNLANQAMRDAQLASADPNLRADLMAQRDRANAYASGRVPSSIDDRAFELGIRSRAADAAAGGGFGVRSSAARKASALMSAEQRIGLSQYGDQLLTSNLEGRSKYLLAPTEYANAGSQISAVPTQSGAQLAAAAQSQLNDKTIISSTDVLQNKTQQEQFKTSTENDVRKFNTSLQSQKDLSQAQLNLQAGTTNVETKLRADLANQGSSLQAQQINAGNQLTLKGIQSQESQFRSQLQFNVDNANANRTFEASNINAGRALEVASSNRATKLEVQKTNSSLIMQDRITRMQEAGANARAAMSAATARESIAAQKAMHDQDVALALQQQANATAAAEQGIKDAHAAKDSGATATLITRAPAIIAGVSTTVSAINNIISSFGGSDSSGIDYSSFVGSEAANAEYNAAAMNASNDYSSASVIPYSS